MEKEQVKRALLVLTRTHDWSRDCWDTLCRRICTASTSKPDGSDDPASTESGHVDGSDSTIHAQQVSAMESADGRLPASVVVVAAPSFDLRGRVRNALDTAASSSETETETETGQSDTDATPKENGEDAVANGASDATERLFKPLTELAALLDVVADDVDMATARKSLSDTMQAVKLLRHIPADIPRKVEDAINHAYVQIITAFIRRQTSTQAKNAVDVVISNCPFKRSKDDVIGTRPVEYRLKKEAKSWREDIKGLALVDATDEECAVTNGVFLAAALDCTLVELWGSTLGFFTTTAADKPADARLLKFLAYDEARELCASEPAICPPSCVELLSLNGLSLQFVWPAATFPWGTLFTAEHGTKPMPPVIKSVALKRNTTLWSMTSVHMWHVSGFLAKVFALFQRHNISIDMISTSDMNLTVTLEPLEEAIDPQVLMEVMRELSRHCSVQAISNCTTISFIGRDMTVASAQLAQMGALDVPVHMVSKSASNLNFSLVVDGKARPNIETWAHEIVLNSLSRVPEASELLGHSAADLVKQNDQLPTSTSTSMDAHVDKVPQLYADRWWSTRARELIELVPADAPAYVYSRSKLCQQLDSLRNNVTAVDCFFYAIKANSHPEILRIVNSRGFGFECVSLRELSMVRSVLPALPPSKLLFTPNFAARSEYEFAIKLGANVTVDSLHCLKQWPSIFENGQILLRIDPGKGRGHHDHVKTAGSASKFGMTPEQAKTAAALCDQHNITVVGLHCHSGSGIFDAATWKDHLLCLSHVARDHFPEARILNVGGGLGVPYEYGQKSLHLQDVQAAVQETKASLASSIPQLTLWMEPGRYIAAECGVLLARVTQVKTKSGVKFVGCVAGMHSLIRPSLYQAFHGVVNLSRLSDAEIEPVAVCGPICESGDVFGRDRPLPTATREGDVLLIDTVGAYGRVMASTYNLRDPGQEIFVS